VGDRGKKKATRRKKKGKKGEKKKSHPQDYLIDPRRGRRKGKKSWEREALGNRVPIRKMGKKKKKRQKKRGEEKKSDSFEARHMKRERGRGGGEIFFV